MTFSYASLTARRRGAVHALVHPSDARRTLPAQRAAGSDDAAEPGERHGSGVHSGYAVA
jgi:hypothetical protein